MQSHHGAATVAGSFLQRPLVWGETRVETRRSSHPLGNTEERAIRESGDPTDGKSSHPSSQREAIMWSFSHVYFSVGCFVSLQLVSSTPLLQRKAGRATDLMSLRPLKCLSAPPRRKSR